jgi:hypothetical protein
MIPAVGLALENYSQDFEGLDQADVGALGADGWLVFGNVFDLGGGYLYGYGPFPAPNDGAAFCALVIGEGGLDQGAQQLSVFSDYNNGDHATSLIESNVFQEQPIGPSDSGTWTFTFDAKLGNLTGATTAVAFIKTLAGSDLTNFITIDMTDTPATWTGYSISIEVDSSLEGQLLQFGFASTATNFEGSGVFYDNVNFQSESVPTEGASWGDVKSLYR